MCIKCFNIKEVIFIQTAFVFFVFYLNLYGPTAGFSQSEPDLSAEVQVLSGSLMILQN